MHLKVNATFKMQMEIKLFTSNPTLANNTIPSDLDICPHLNPSPGYN